MEEDNSNRYKKIAEQYLSEILSYFEKNNDWWNVAKKEWMSGEYGSAIEKSLNIAKEIVDFKNPSADAKKLYDLASDFVSAIMRVRSIAEEAEKNTRMIRIIEGASRRNDFIKDMASRTYDVFDPLVEFDPAAKETSSENEVFESKQRERIIHAWWFRTTISSNQVDENKVEGKFDFRVGFVDEPNRKSLSEIDSSTRFFMLDANKNVVNILSASLKDKSSVNDIQGEILTFKIEHIFKRIISHEEIVINTNINNLTPLTEDTSSPKSIFFPFTLEEEDKVLPYLLKQASSISENSQIRELELKTCLHSDEYSINDEDILGYDLHAANLFNIMTDKQTNPPLNIGILAPWGRGKTSLMRKVEHMFVKERKKKLEENKKENLPKPTLRNLKSWLNNEELFPVYKIPYATVWFNPWNYQSSEMIWAGMANAIVEQVVDQMPNETAKETFWFQLRLARIDKQELRKELQIRATLFVLQFIVWGIALVTAIAMFYINKPAAGWGIIGIGSILGVFSSVASYLKPNKKDIAEVFEKYTKAPQYLNKLGTFHDVQEDLKKVFSLLISEKEPLVIFVDDLDRCSPSKVVEVVEAINVFISGEHRKKCYFVLGMDAEIVAASLDVAYEKMKGKIINRETEQGSLGWYFLDKFIQLPFFIPVINEEKKLDYLESLLKQSIKNDGQGHVNTSNLTEQEAQNKAKQALAAPTPEEASKAFENLNKAETKEVEIAILKQQVEENHDDEEISKQVGKYAVYLNSDPRSLKRFANLLRFYNSYQVLRMKKGQKHIPISYLGKYLALMLKFPQLIRWIQWDTENRNGLSTSADIKVKLIDDAINELVKHEKQEERFRYWNDANYLSEDKKITKENIKLIIEMQKDMPWLKSQSLINILMSESMEESELSNALKCNVW